jgi:hypothetical protein
VGLRALRRRTGDRCGRIRCCRSLGVRRPCMVRRASPSAVAGRKRGVVSEGAGLGEAFRSLSLERPSGPLVLITPRINRPLGRSWPNSSMVRRSAAGASWLARTRLRRGWSRLGGGCWGGRRAVWLPRRPLALMLSIGRRRLVPGIDGANGSPDGTRASTRRTRLWIVLTNEVAGANSVRAARADSLRIAGAGVGVSGTTVALAGTPRPRLFRCSACRRTPGRRALRGGRRLRRRGRCYAVGQEFAGQGQPFVVWQGQRRGDSVVGNRRLPGDAATRGGSIRSRHRPRPRRPAGPGSDRCPSSP